MSTFLELCVDLRREAGIAGTGPTATTSQAGELLRLVEWVNYAWVSIQNLSRDWLWMRASVTATTSASDGTYTTSDFGITEFGRWHPNSFRVYVTATGQSDEQHMYYMDYDDFRNVYDFGSNASTTGRPFHFTIAPDKSIKVGPLPDSTGYTIKGDYQKRASELSGDSDTPELPTEYHQIIVWRALMLYGMFESAPEVLAQAKGEYNSMLFGLRLNQLPGFMMAGPMVA